MVHRARVVGMRPERNGCGSPKSGLPGGGGPLTLNDGFKRALKNYPAIKESVRARRRHEEGTAFHARPSSRASTEVRNRPTNNVLLLCSTVPRSFR